MSPGPAGHGSLGVRPPVWPRAHRPARAHSPLLATLFQLRSSRLQHHPERVSSDPQMTWPMACGPGGTDAQTQNRSRRTEKRKVWFLSLRRGRWCRHVTCDTPEQSCRPLLRARGPQEPLPVLLSALILPVPTTPLTWGSHPSYGFRDNVMFRTYPARPGPLQSGRSAFASSAYSGLNAHFPPFPPRVQTCRALGLKSKPSRKQELALCRL